MKRHHYQEKGHRSSIAIKFAITNSAIPMESGRELLQMMKAPAVTNTSTPTLRCAIFDSSLKPALPLEGCVFDLIPRSGDPYLQTIGYRVLTGASFCYETIVMCYCV